MLRDRGQHTGQDDFGAADGEFARCGVGEELDALEPLAHLVEYVDGRIEQCPSIRRRLNALGATVEQADAEGLLQLGNRLGDNGMRDGKPGGRFRHAASLGHREHDVKVAQTDATAYAI